MTAASGSVMGFFLNLVIAYTIQDIDAVIESDLVGDLYIFTGTDTLDFSGF